MNRFQRFNLLVGDEHFNIIKDKCVCIIGIGGVGSYSSEAIARCGVNKIILIDNDTISKTNINRQIHALTSTIGQNKVDAMKNRILDINPNCEVIALKMNFNNETMEDVFKLKPDFIIDAFDTITFKILLIEECLKRNIKFVSSMGTANKMDPTKFEIMDLKKTSIDPIARVLRGKLKHQKGKIPVLISSELPMKQTKIVDESNIRKESMPPASNSFVPSTAGLILASYVINSFMKG